MASNPSAAINFARLFVILDLIMKPPHALSLYVENSPPLYINNKMVVARFCANNSDEELFYIICKMFANSYTYNE